MKTVTAIFACLIFFLSPSLVDAQQLLRRLKNAAEEGVARAVERRVVSEVEKATQRQFEKAFGNLYGGPQGGAEYDFSKILGSINTNVATEESYQFYGMAEMEITGTEANGKTTEPARINSLLSNDNQLSGMEFVDPESKKNGQRSVIIFDFKNNAMIMLVEEDGKKTRIAFGSDWEKMTEDMAGMDNEVDGDPADSKPEDFTFEKTGRTKTIIGYACEEYVAKTEEMEASYWISKDPIVGLQAFWGNNSPFLAQRLRSTGSTGFDKFPEGGLMEMNFVSKTDKSTSNLTMVAIDTNKTQTFVMADYTNGLATQ